MEDIDSTQIEQHASKNIDSKKKLMIFIGREMDIIMIDLSSFSSGLENNQNGRDKVIMLFCLRQV